MVSVEYVFRLLITWFNVCGMYAAAADQVITNASKISYVDNSENFEDWVSIIESNVDHGHVTQQSNFKLSCKVSTNHIEDIANFKLQWVHKNMKIMKEQGQWSQSKLKIQNDYIERILTLSNASTTYSSGKYKCFANENYNYVSILVIPDSDYGYIKIVEEANISDIFVQEGQLVNMVVEYFGYPNPIKIVWTSPGNYNIEHDHPFYHIETEESHSTLTIKSALTDHNGEYFVFGTNAKALAMYKFSLTVHGKHLKGMSSTWILIIIGVFILMACVLGLLCMKIRRDAVRRRKLQEIGIANFIIGDLEHINYALSLDEQAELLPYDERFEFPRHKLHLGKQLGVGAFGIVYKGTADDIVPNEDKTQVAVKMVKKTADAEVVRALLSELKIMVHLGQHLNVVNLLGAVTKNINNRELMIIVEFCRFGNVQNFLYKNRQRFINQINPENDSIDSNITDNLQKVPKNSEDTLNRLNHHSILSSARGSTSKKYLTETEIDSQNKQMDNNISKCLFPTSENLASDNSNESDQPVWRSNYKSDSTDAMEITTSHLVSWAFQVARGMDYLSSRNVLHGDLAARNILLCEDNIVKICDFGLARSMYNNNNYKKDKDARVPVKWLALESLGDRVFSTRSDVWSFGIVLWEFFSLSKVPYPGMEADQSLYERLKNGYRMEKPQYANKELYEIILQCWEEDPESRPLFDELEERFAKIMGDQSTNHFVDMDKHYLRLNSEIRKSRHTDYLSLGNRFDDITLPSKNIRTYLELNNLNEQKASRVSGYLEMKAISQPSAAQSNETTDKSYFLKTSSRQTLHKEMELLPLSNRDDPYPSSKLLVPQNLSTFSKTTLNTTDNNSSSNSISINLTQTTDSIVSLTDSSLENNIQIDSPAIRQYHNVHDILEKKQKG